MTPSGKLDWSFRSWNGLTLAKPEMSRRVLSTSARGDATVFNPVSLPSFRVAQSKPAERRGSRTPTKSPALFRGSEDPTGPTCPAPPATKLLAIAPLYPQPVNANVLITLLLDPESGVIERRAE